MRVYAIFYYSRYHQKPRIYLGWGWMDEDSAEATCEELNRCYPWREFWVEEWAIHSEGKPPEQKKEDRFQELARTFL